MVDAPVFVKDLRADMAVVAHQADVGKTQGEADKILLKGQSLGNGQTIDFTQTGVIAKTADGNYTLTIEGTGTVYTKARQ